MKLQGLQKTISKSRYILIAITVLVTFFYTPIGTSTTFAEAKCDPEFESLNNITHQSNCAETTATCSNSASTSIFSNQDYAGREVFSTAQQEAIEANKTFYENAGTAHDVPWQLLATIHGRETGFKKYGPSNGYGPYQITPSSYPIKAEYTDQEFQTATNDAAASLKTRAGNRDMSDPNTIKFVLFSYNGRAQKYIDQGIALGFSAEEAANGEGSPYVMNKFDEKRDPTVEPTKSNGTWGQVKRDHGPVEYPANSDPGAFVYYSALSNSSLCGSGAVAKNGDANSVQAAFTDYMNSHNESYAPFGYKLGVNGCTTLSSWYIGELTNVKYNRGNGEAVVRNLVAANADKGLVATDKPTAPAIFSVAGGSKSWGASGISAGHVGVVVSVDEATQTATVVHTGSSKAGQKEKAWVSQYQYPASGVTFVNVGEYLK